MSKQDDWIQKYLNGKLNDDDVWENDNNPYANYPSDSYANYPKVPESIEPEHPAEAEEQTEEPFAPYDNPEQYPIEGSSDSNDEYDEPVDWLTDNTTDNASGMNNATDTTKGVPGCGYRLIIAFAISLCSMLLSQSLKNCKTDSSSNSYDEYASCAPEDLYTEPYISPYLEERPAKDSDYDRYNSRQVFTVNGFTFTMIKVKGGEFEMGNDTGSTEERPQHHVKLSTFMIGQTEVTYQLWNAVMDDKRQCEDMTRPITGVSWKDCQLFISKLNELTGEDFNLPTEAQWEFAAKGGNYSASYIYSGSNDIEDVAWYQNYHNDAPHPVAKKTPNELGLYDMSGNVSEWCYDWWDSYSKKYDCVNPVITGNEQSSGHVIRGGSWRSAADRCASTVRTEFIASGSDDWLGFRLAL